MLVVNGGIITIVPAGFAAAEVWFTPADGGGRFKLGRIIGRAGRYDGLLAGGGIAGRGHLTEVGAAKAIARRYGLL